ncbi:MAG: 8-oxo-dGTP diphosphatase MutT [Alphaproteobacteria bacterium]|nr:8-oxo-dGTP diphosphatase MutT [Alphaproteobacteria bacterium]|tara:strand:+ start:1083 stop:1541 length:459 start_codon:yes stop_codon:yes gene_type:complete
MQQTSSCFEELEKPRPKRSGLPLLHVAAAALIDENGKILISQRPEGKSMAGLWEFPGGKIEEGESPEFTLMRELYEELDIETRPCCFSPIGFASHEYKSFHLLMPLFVCRVWQGEPKPKEGQTLKWVTIRDLYDYAMPPADIPLISQLLDNL